MKKKTMRLFAFAMLCLSATTGTAANANTLYGKDITAVKGATSQTMSLYMGNQTTICGMQFDMYLPDGITIKSITLGAERFEDLTYTLASEKQADGAIRVFCATSMLTDAIWDDDIDGKDIRQTAPVLNVTLGIAEGCGVGAYDVELGNITFSHYDEATRTATKLLGDNSASMLMIKPSSGKEAREKNGTVSMATAKGVALSRSDIENALAGKENITCLDLRAAELSKGISSAAELKVAGLSENSLFMLPAGTGVIGENIITDRRCESLKLTDGAPFAVPVAFDAVKASYERVMANAWGTICLPYETKSGGNVQFYVLSSVDAENGKMYFDKVDGLKAGEAGIYKKTGGSHVEMTASNVEVPVMTEAAVTETAASNFTMKGCLKETRFEGLDPNSDEGIYYIKSNKFLRGNGILTMPAFRAYFIAENVAGAKFDISDEEDGNDQVTRVQGGLQTLDSRLSAGQMYNLQGMQITETESGIVISNGKKYLKR